MNDPIELKYKKMLENGLRKVKESKELSQNNKDVIFDFVERCHADGIGTKRIVKLIGMIFRIVGWLNVDFRDADKKDIIRVLADIEKSGFKPWTIWSYKRVLKKLYKFLERPDITENIQVKIKKQERINPNDVLTQDDISKLLSVTRHPRDRAFIALISETGARLEEMQRMRINNIQMSKQVIISVPGVKDSPKIREVPIIDSVPYLRVWLDQHPKVEDPDNWLWVSLCSRTYGTQLSAAQIHKILSDAKQKAGIRKPCFPHAFRHARATLLANHFTESQLCWWFGWRPGSKMATTYVHLSRNHVEDALYRMRGICIKCKSEPVLPGSDYCKVCIKDTNGKADNRLAPKKCPRCWAENESIATHCMRCGLSFDPQERLQFEKEKAMFEKVVRKDRIKEQIIEELKKEIMKNLKQKDNLIKCIQ